MEWKVLPLVRHFRLLVALSRSSLFCWQGAPPADVAPRIGPHAGFKAGRISTLDAMHDTELDLLRQEQLELADFALHRITHAVNAPLLQRLSVIT